MNNIDCIREGKAVLGIELGSTRIKALLIGEDHAPIAQGNHEWENRYVNGNWTYDLEDIWKGIQDSYRKMVQDVKEKYDITLTTVGAIGISAMMHGYMAFNKQEDLLVPFRTWRNTYTEQASKQLTELFQYNIPQRWSIAHLYQAILNKEEHVNDIDYLVTLSGYVHWQLTGRKVLGIGDISGMFPVDIKAKTYNSQMIELFDNVLNSNNIAWRLKDVLPEPLYAGLHAGSLTEKGAKFLDPSGSLQPGIPFCPPEGDAGTGMTATNSVAKHTGNISAGTSIFAMVVLEKELNKIYPEIDLVTTPSGNLVAMVHCNNCTSDLNAWVSLFKEYSNLLGVEVETDNLYSTLYNIALNGDKDCGGLLAYGYLSGEHITHFEKGCPIFIRKPDSKFNLANFMRVHLFSSVSTLKIGMDILRQEDIRINTLRGHGGFFKTKEVGQRIMAAAMNIPVSVNQSAGEGGAWGVALLAAYMLYKKESETLEDYLETKVFSNNEGSVLSPDPEEVKDFEHFMERYIKGLEIEKAAVEFM